MAGTFLPEPHTMAMARTPEELKTQSHSKDEENIDYRKIPRSSGDGMEHNGNGAECKNYPKHIPHSNHMYTPHNGNDLVLPFVTSEDQKQHKKALSTKFGISNVQSANFKTRQTVHKIENDHKHFQEIHERKDFPDVSSLTQDERKGLVSEKEFISNKTQTKLGTYGSQSEMVSAVTGHQTPDKDTFNTITDECMESISKDGDTIQAEHSYSEMQDIIKELEERNSKLIEEKTKLCVQLGLQTQVNSEIKKLLVAAVGDDLDNSLEALLMKNAQSAVEIKHWKTLSEEYAVESDKLAIECDVWRTKFMASRMMSDELSSWKTTLYTKYKQTQNALQRILSERAELKNHLVTTKRLLHSLGHVVKCNTSSFKSAEVLNETHNTHQQSVLELASITSCLLHDLAVQIQDTFDSSSIPAEALSLTEEAEKQTVEPTPAEKLAIQVLSSDVELYAQEQQEESNVMKRMGKQYIGNSYYSRLMTNSFRVTYDCCDRCRGPIQVV